jgi:hypothetical protein
VAAPAVATALGIGVSVAVPLVGLAFAGVLMGVEALMNTGCGPTCVQTSEWANQAEPLLLQNIQKYFSLPAPRSSVDQQGALNIFDAVWQGLVQRCSQQGLGTAGQHCISDRQAGACQWRQTATSPLLKFPGEPQPGECWNWFSGYRDPIANDATVSTVPQLSSDPIGSIAAATGFSSSNLILGAAALLIILGVSQ